jgi:hypothetical protein
VTTHIVKLSSFPFRAAGSMLLNAVFFVPEYWSTVAYKRRYDAAPGAVCTVMVS